MKSQLTTDSHHEVMRRLQQVVQKVVGTDQAPELQEYRSSKAVTYNSNAKQRKKHSAFVK